MSRIMYAPAPRVQNGDDRQPLLNRYRFTRVAVPWYHPRGVNCAGEGIWSLWELREYLGPECDADKPVTTHTLLPLWVPPDTALKSRC